MKNTDNTGYKEFTEKARIIRRLVTFIPSLLPIPVLFLSEKSYIG